MTPEPDGLGTPPGPEPAVDVARRRRLFLVGLAVATVVGLLESTKAWLVNRAMGNAQTVVRALEVNMPWWLLWVVLAVGVAWLTDRVPLRRPFLRPVALHAAASVGFSVVHLALAAAAIWGTAPPGYPMSLGSQFRLLSIGYFFMELVTYWAIVGGYSAWVAAQRSRRSEEERRRLAVAAARAEAERARLERGMVEARLQALRAELNPHFLFNAMNGVVSLADAGDTGGAVTMLTRLADLLRRTLDGGDEDEVTLAEEMEVVRLYLAIEEVRYGARLRVVERIDEGALDVLVPPLLLQPLVENAVRHGVAKVNRPVDIEIRAAVEDGRLAVGVADTGPGPGPRDGRGTGGVGLRNVRERLETLHGDAGALVVEDRAEGGVVARVELPARRPSPTRITADSAAHRGPP